MIEPDNELRRFDTVPLELVATLPGTRCDDHDDCDLSRDHDTNCAVVSPVGLVHKVLPSKDDVSNEELEAMRKIVTAFSELEDVYEEVEYLIHCTERSGPPRLRKLLRERFSVLSIEWPIPADEKHWRNELADFSDD